MRASGRSRCNRRTVCRTSSSAVEVTVHVLSTSTSASADSLDCASPLAIRPDSIAAPSACDARHPKFLIQNRSKVQFNNCPATRLALWSLIVSRDQPRAPIEAHVLKSPPDENDHPVAKLHQIHQVNEQPREPC